MSKDKLVCTHIFGHNLLNITGPVLMGVMLALTITRQKKADLILQTPIYTLLVGKKTLDCVFPLNVIIMDGLYVSTKVNVSSDKLDRLEICC
jgi:hypothetical protein